MNKMRQWSLFTAVAVVVVFAAGWFLAVSPQRHHAADFRSQAASQDTANSALQLQVAQLEQQKKGLPEQQRQLAKYATRIPDNPELPVLIRQLSTAAKDAGVDLVSMSPSVPAAVAAAPGSTVPATSGALNQISLQLTVKGSYYNLESWFAAVEKLPRAMMVTQWSMTPGVAAAQSSGSGSSDSGAAQQDPPGTMTATMTALVYEAPTVTPASVTPATAQ